MRRVTSRQRLFSWDQFDAAAPETDVDSECGSQADSDYRSCLSVSHSHAGSGNYKSVTDGNGHASEAPYTLSPSRDRAALGSAAGKKYDQAFSFGPSRSSSMLSLKNFSAHASFDEIDNDSDYSIECISIVDGDLLASNLDANEVEIATAQKIAAVSLEVPSLLTDTTCANDLSTVTRNKKRRANGMKKSVSFSTLPQDSKNASDTTTYSAMSSLTHLVDLSQDVQIQCLSFLDVDDLKELSETCKYFWNMLIADQTTSETTEDIECDDIKSILWWGPILRRFPNLKLDAQGFTPHDVKFVKKKSVSEIYNKEEINSAINYPALLSLSMPSPSTINEKHLKPTQTLNRRIPTLRMPSTPSISGVRLLAMTQRMHSAAEAIVSETSSPFRKFVLNDLIDSSKEKMEVVQYTGPVGAGDRSIVSDDPLPFPTQRILRGKSHMMNAVGKYISKALDKHPPAQPLRPFVSPFVSARSGVAIEIDLTPRTMAYFEVSILPNPDPDASQSMSQCVAVGLSTRNFRSSLRMPGWDQFSFGYHGDDGGLFHSHGEMIRVYGPRYNVGDTVGCGVNYLNGGIFFTLNGDFLGYAWLNEQIVTEAKDRLFPTVGVDSNDLIACNYGNERPFVFNFSRFIANGGNNMPSR